MSAGTTTRDGFDRRLLVPMMLGASLNPVNSSIIAVALAPIGRALGEPASETAWLVSSLYLATAIGQPLVGRLVDTYGPRRLFLLGSTLTGIAGLIGMVAPNLGVLVAARIVLGFGTCAGYPATMYLIRSESRRTGQDRPANVLTALSVTTQTVIVVGPTIGGLLIDLGGWRATFAVNVPLAIACAAMGWRYLPRHTALEDAGESRFADWSGVLLFTGTLVALLLFLMSPHVDLLWLLAVTAAAAAAFTLRELRTADPFLDVRVFGGNVPLLVTYVRGVLTATVTYCFLYGFSQWLEDGRGLSASTAGLVLVPCFGMGIVVAFLTGRRPEIKAKLVVGGIVLVVGCVLLLLVPPGVSIVLLLLVTAVIGIPQGLLNLANQNATYFQADPERVGASAGLLRTFMYLGAILASAATGAFFGHHATTPGLHHLAAFMLGSAAILAIVTVLDRSLARVGRPADATT